MQMMQAASVESKGLSMLALHEVRWLAVDQCLGHLIAEWTPLLNYFNSESSDCSGRAVYEDLTDVELILAARAARPMLSALQALSKACQARDVHFWELAAAVEDCKTFIAGTYDIHRPDAFGGQDFKELADISFPGRDTFSFLELHDDGSLHYNADGNWHRVCWLFAVLMSVEDHTFKMHIDFSCYCR